MMGKFEEYGKITQQELNYIINNYSISDQKNNHKFKKELISIFQEADIDNNKCIEGNELDIFNNKIKETIIGTIKVFGKKVKLDAIADWKKARKEFKVYQQYLPYEVFDCSADKKVIDDKSIEHFNKFLQNNNSNLSEDKLKLLNEIKQLLIDGKISFKDTITDSRLQELSQLEDKYLYLFVRSADLAEKDETLNNEIVQDLLNEDYSAFDKLTNKNEYHKDNLRVVLDKYKEIKGISFYNNLINLYENNDISKETFIQNMTKILKSYNTENLPKLLENQEAFNIEQFKNFDFDKYVAENINYNNEEYTNTNSQYFNDLHLEQPLNLKDTWVEPYLPNIKNQQIDENTVLQNFNDKEYKIEQNEKLISITNTQNNNNWVLDLDKILSNITDKDDIEKIKNAIKNLPAPVLIDMSKYIHSIYIYNDINEEKNGEAFIKRNNNEKGQANIEGHIEINLENTSDLVGVLTHEIGHIVRNDIWANANFDESIIAKYDIGKLINDNKNYSIALEMMNQIFKDNHIIMDSNHEHVGDLENDELTPELYAIFNLGTSNCDNENIMNYFKIPLQKMYEAFSNRLNNDY